MDEFIETVSISMGLMSFDRKEEYDIMTWSKLS